MLKKLLKKYVRNKKIEYRIKLQFICFRSTIVCTLYRQTTLYLNQKQMKSILIVTGMPEKIDSIHSYFEAQCIGKDYNKCLLFEYFFA